MKAVQVHAFGGRENLRIEDIPTPSVGPGQILVRVMASGIVFGDILTRQGLDPRLPDAMPYTPGMEIAGVVEAVGPNVEGLTPGARVMSFVPDGGYAEYCLAWAAQAVVLPDAVSFAEGLAYLINMPVAHLVYNTFGAVKPNDTILLHAASGGVGSLITQIAKRRGGNTVIALASSEAKADYCRAQGADHVILYKSVDYVQEVLRLTNGVGVDVSLNSVAGPTLETDPYAIRQTGRWAIYGYAAGQRPIDPFKHFLRSLTINVSAAYAYLARPEFLQAQAFLKDWLQTEPLLSPTRSFALDDVQAAHRWIEDQQSVGKIILTP